jgi:hypothetical protein
MPTLFDKQTQDVMLARVGKLTSNSQRKWGKMSVSQMLKHMSVAFAVPTGKIKLPKDKLYYLSANPFARWLLVKAITKWPKNMVTAADFIVKDEPDFESTKKELTDNIHAFLTAAGLNGQHPVFGVMSKELWGEAMYIHLNHHLEQFGV